jgi:hypothetical protein
MMVNFILFGQERERDIAEEREKPAQQRIDFPPPLLLIRKTAHTHTYTHS